MAVFISWTITTLDHIIENGVVQRIHYTAAATDGALSAVSYGSVNLDPPGATIVPYSSISEDMAKNWLLNKLSAPVVLSTENQLVAELNERKRPTKANGLPWAG